jgi:isoquinoline 1-oxidoreductase subunit alpha
MPIQLSVNSKTVAVDAADDTPLLWALRDELNLTGTKYGCGAAQCGACTVLVDGQAVRSCVTPLAAIAGQNITTIEGAQSKTALAVKATWEKLAVAQCGYCQSGQIMSATSLLESNKEPSDADIDAAMTGNLCRCATYQRIREAIKVAARELTQGA